MSNASIIVDVYFLEYGKHAPKNSRFRGSLSEETIFGKNGWLTYTIGKEATKKSVNKDKSENDSFYGYTSRDAAIANSADEYFTMSNEGRLYTQADRERWIQNSLSAFSSEGDIAWEFTVSIESFDRLKEYQIKDQNDLSRIAEISLLKVFHKLRLDPQNMIWWEDYHTNTAHPHMHITFMEKSRTRTRGKLTPKELNAVKNIFITEIGARKKFADKYNQRYEDTLKEVEKEKRIVVSQISELPYHTYSDILDLYAVLPDKGRLQYNSVHIKPYREKIDIIVDDLLNVQEIQEEYTIFLNHLDKLEATVNEMGNEKISVIKEREDEKLRIQIANVILKNCKEFRAKYPAMVKRAANWKDATSEKLIRQICSEQEKIAINEDIRKGYSFILAGNTEGLETILKKLGRIPEAEFMKGADDILNKKKASGLVKMMESRGKGNCCAQQFLNFYNKSYHTDKKTFHVMKRSCKSLFYGEAITTIKNHQKRISREIDAYLYNRKSESNRDEEFDISQYLRGNQ